MLYALTFIAGCFIGGFLGVAIMACMFVAKDTDKELGIDG